VTLYYGPNRQYYEQVYDSGSTIEKTIYAGGLLEKVTLGSLVDWRHYIRVNNELIAIMSRQSSGTNVTHYVLSDHEGSIATITDGSAATTVTESFSAFGTRRNPSTWSGIPTCPDLCNITSISREGYTGHDAMGGVSMGLNHMNGRVQDAITGRFLSPDPTLSDPTNTQSFNRYSYVNNNPLTYTDPTGFDTKLCPSDGTCPMGGGAEGGAPDPGPVPTLPPIAPGSMSSGDLDPGWSCYGNCDGRYANSTQVLNSYAPETVSVANANGSTSSFIEDADAGGDPALQVEAPGYHWVSNGILDQGFNYATFAAAATPYNMGRILTQFVGGTAGLAGGTAGLAAVGARSVPAAIGAVYGGIGGYQARGWPGVMPGAAIGAALGGAGGWAGDTLAGLGVTGWGGCCFGIIDGRYIRWRQCIWRQCIDRQSKLI
jgi:RHS repeat-associated protein